jgi:hypothetical protein
MRLRALSTNILGAAGASENERKRARPGRNGGLTGIGRKRRGRQNAGCPDGWDLNVGPRTDRLRSAFPALSLVSARYLTGLMLGSGLSTEMGLASGLGEGVGLPRCPNPELSGVSVTP